MRRLHILVEGQTEEVICREVIEPHFASHQIWMTTSILKTKRPAGGPSVKGGLTSWMKVRNELRLLLRDTSISVLTTMFDYYAFPEGAPGMANRPHSDPYDRVKHVEHAMFKAIDDKRFLPHLMLHETEAWVLADCACLGSVMGSPEGGANLQSVVHSQGGPELVNDGVDTAPSKRILAAYPDYRKTIDGPLAIADAGLGTIRGTCPHADQWLREIEARLDA